MKEPIRKVNKNAVSVVRTGCPCTTVISMIASIVLSLSHCTLGIFATEKYVNHRDEYGLEIPTNLKYLHFHGLERPLNCLKSKMAKIEENVNETVKHCPK